MVVAVSRMTKLIKEMKTGSPVLSHEAGGACFRGPVLGVEERVEIWKASWKARRIPVRFSARW